MLRNNSSLPEPGGLTAWVLSDGKAGDELQALSVAEENGRTILWIASDDNFMGFQRTLLLKFALDPPVAA